MRMWMIDPRKLCRKHLLGEHGEIHKHRHIFEKQWRIDGRIFPVVQIEPVSMKERHDLLAEEMLRRGYNHQSPYGQPDISYLGEKGMVKVDVNNSIQVLISRCPDCAERMSGIHEPLPDELFRI